MIIPGFLISWATFPGVIVHEFAHKTACEWRDVRVSDVQYFGLDGGGYVQHRRPSDYRNTLLISTAPFFLNTLLAIGLYALAGALVVGIIPFPSDVPSIAVAAFVGWIALSVGWHAFPSSGDTKNIWREVKQHWRRSPLAALFIPVVTFLFVANILRFFWFDAIYALALAGLTWMVLQTASTIDVIAVLTVVS